MTEKRLAHEKLGFIPDWTSEITQKIILNVNTTSFRKIKFEYVSDTERGDPDNILPDFASLDSPTTDLLDIHIYETSFVQIWLAGNLLDWFWRPEDAITTCYPNTARYFNLEYFLNGTWIRNPNEDDRCQGVRFGAILRNGNPGPDTNDPFNMNVILDWGDNHFLPMTIDPDIQNPGVGP